MPQLRLGFLLSKLLFSLSYHSPCQLDEIHGQVGESHTARNFRNFGQPLGVEAGLELPVRKKKKKRMLSVLQLKGNKFCPRTRSLEAHYFAGEPPHERASSVAQCEESAYHAGSFSRENPLEEEMATLSNILAWEISWTEEPHGLQSMELRKSLT